MSAKGEARTPERVKMARMAEVFILMAWNLKRCWECGFGLDGLLWNAV